jgi:glycosyltransferase involved in cell wall biosynthesis
MPNQAVKVLHILGSLERGGAETWAVQLLEAIDPQRVQIDFLLHRRGGVYENRVKSRGANIHYCGHPYQLLKYSYNVKKVFQNNAEPYDVVHSHLQNFNGLLMRIAYHAKISGRIAHARNSNDGQGQMPQRIIYRAIMRNWIKSYATHLFAVSTEAAEGAFGYHMVQERNPHIMTGIDFSPFQTKINANQLREALAIPKTSYVIGHIGSFRQQKNHQFLVKIAQELKSLQANILFLLIGEGSLKQSIEESVSALGLEQNFRFLGERQDIHQLLQIMDIFVFPSLYEGLPRVLLEAQAAGIACIVSHKITKEVDAGLGAVSFMDIEKDPKVWAQKIFEAIQQQPLRYNGTEAIKRFQERGLTIEENANELSTLYEQIANDTIKI